MEDAISMFRLPTRLKQSKFTPEDVLATTKLDKKMESGRVKFILLEKPGEAYITKELEDAQILEGIRYLFS